MNNSERDRQYPDRINYDYYWRVARGQYRIDVCKENVKEIFGSPDKISSSAQFRSGKTFKVCVAMIYIPIRKLVGVREHQNARLFLFSWVLFYGSFAEKRLDSLSGIVYNSGYFISVRENGPKSREPSQRGRTLMSLALSGFIMFFYDLRAYGKPSRAESKRMKARAARSLVGG